jgi:hypothetical protein
MASKLNSSWNIRGFKFPLHAYSPPPSSCFFLVKTYELIEACKSQISQVIHKKTLLAMDLQYLTISNQVEDYTTKEKLVNILSHLGQGRSTSFSNCSFFAMEFGKSQTSSFWSQFWIAQWEEISTYQRPLIIINTMLWCWGERREGMWG